MKISTRLAQKGRKAHSRPGTVNLPVTRASTGYQTGRRPKKLQVWIIR